MSALSSIARMHESLPLDSQRPTRRNDGLVLGWLSIGDIGELSLYGTPQEMRRLGRAAFSAAKAAEELACHVRAEAPSQARALRVAQVPGGECA